MKPDLEADTRGAGAQGSYGMSLERVGRAADAQRVAVYDQLLLAGVLIAFAAFISTTNPVVVLLEELGAIALQTVQVWLYHIGGTIAFVGAVGHVLAQLFSEGGGPLVASGSSASCPCRRSRVASARTQRSGAGCEGATAWLARMGDFAMWGGRRELLLS